MYPALEVLGRTTEHASEIGERLLLPIFKSMNLAAKHQHLKTARYAEPGASRFPLVVKVWGQGDPETDFLP